jgi:imidazolonepropionase-like amidohydrolase
MVLLLKNTTLIDGSGGAPLPGSDVLIEGDRFTSIGPTGTVLAPAGAAVADLTAKWLLPGLIDLHVHPYSAKGDVQGHPVHETDPYAALSAARNLRDALYAGITTVRDVGPHGAIGVPLRRAVNEGLIEGSRVFTCVRFISQTGGHGGDLEADGPFGVRQAVREVWKAGADFIKFAVNGSRSVPEYTVEEIRSIVDEARRLRLRIACHASLLQPTRDAVAAGVDTIEHGCQLDEALAKEIADKGIILVPTVLVYVVLLDMARRGELEPVFGEAIKHRCLTHRRAVEIALDAGVKIGAGTDMVLDARPFACLPEELKTLVEFGVPPMQAIQAATSVAAEALGKQDILGTIAPGKLADCIVVDEDPVRDIGALGRVKGVIQAGRVVRGIAA